MAKIPGTAVASPIVPLDSGLPTPTHTDTYGKGGWVTVASLAERNTIPMERRKAGMVAVVTDASGSTPWQLTNNLSDWGPFIPPSFPNAGLFTSESAGIAGTEPDEWFYVVDETGKSLYRNVAGVATFISLEASAAELTEATASAQANAGIAQEAREDAQIAAQTSTENAQQTNEDRLATAADVVIAAAQADIATAQAGIATTQAGIAIAAAEASGNVLFFDTYADAETALPGLAEGQVVETFVPNYRYRVEEGVLEFKIDLGKFNPDLSVNALEYFSPDERAAVKAYTLTTDIRLKLKAASDAALASGKSLYLPAGLYIIEANNGLSTGWFIEFSAGQSLLIHGDGPGTILRRRATATLSPASTMVWMRQREGVSVYWRSLMMDGNEQNCPVDSQFLFDGDGVTKAFSYTSAAELSPTLITDGVEVIAQDLFYTNDAPPNRQVVFHEAPAVGTQIRLGNVFLHEQSANVKWAPGTSGAIAETVGFHNVWMTNMVSDAYHANIQTKNLQISDWESFGRTRRPRADVQLSRIPTVVTNVVNYVGDSFEMEPSLTNTTHQINLTNMLVRGAFDLGGDVQSTVDANMKVVNVKALNTFGIGLRIINIFRIRGSFVNCYLRGIRRIERCGVVFDNCEIVATQVEADAFTARGTDFFLSNATANQFARFKNCQFSADAGIVYGTYFRGGSANTRNDVIMEFDECDVLSPVDYLTTMTRTGAMVARGGKLAARKAVMLTGASGGFVSSFEVADTVGWDTPALFEFSSMASVNTPVRVSGVVDAERSKLFAFSLPDTNGGLMQPAIEAIGMVDSDPTGRLTGITGLRAKLKNPGPAGVDEWQYKNGVTVNSVAGWRASNNDQPYVYQTTYDAPSLADGVGTVARIPGAFQPGDLLVSSFGVNLQGMLATPYVAEPGVAGVRVQNESGGTVDLASTLVRVRKFADAEIAAQNQVTYDMPSTAAGAGVTITVVLPGAALGDFVVAALGTSNQGAIQHAWVSATDTVSVRFQNEIVGRVASVTVDGAGAGYTSAPAVTLTGGGGLGAKAIANISGTIPSIVVESVGLNYTSVPTVSFSGGGGSGLTATAVVEGRRVVGVTVTNPGSGYTYPPTVIFSGGTASGVPATARAILSASVTSITIVDGGTEYTSPPTVAFSGGGGTGAAGTAVVATAIDAPISFLKVAKLKTMFKRFISVTYDPPSLADGETVTTTVGLSGSALGDFVVASFSENLQGVILTAYVSAGRTITCVFQNETGGTIDLASGTLRVAIYNSLP